MIGNRRGLPRDRNRFQSPYDNKRLVITIKERSHIYITRHGDIKSHAIKIIRIHHHMRADMFFFFGVLWVIYRWENINLYICIYVCPSTVKTDVVVTWRRRESCTSGV